MRRIADTFIQSLKQQVLHSQIVNGFQHARETRAKRRVIRSLCLNWQYRELHRSVVESHLQLADDENNKALAAYCFDLLKRHLFERRTKALALHHYALNLIKRTIAGLKYNTMLEVVDKGRVLKVMKLQQRRYLGHWMEAMQKKT